MLCILHYSGTLSVYSSCGAFPSVHGTVFKSHGGRGRGGGLDDLEEVSRAITKKTLNKCAGTTDIRDECSG